MPEVNWAEPIQPTGMANYEEIICRDEDNDDLDEVTDEKLIDSWIKLWEEDIHKPCDRNEEHSGAINMVVNGPQIEETTKKEIIL